MEDRLELKAIALQRAIEHHASDSHHPRKPVPATQIVATAKQFLGFLAAADGRAKRGR